MVEDESTNLLIGDANPLRRSGMGFGSIFASIDKRGLKVGKFFVFLFH
jgi:hypothetical protein